MHLLPVGVGKHMTLQISHAGDGVKAQPWRRKAMHDGSPDPDQEAKARHQAQLEQRHLEAYRNMHRLRKAPCRRYAALLSDKVSSQRALLQQREEAARGKSESEAQQKQKKLSFSKLLHDDSYLKPLPKTSYYLRQLSKHGHLKTHHDLEDFYRGIKYNRHPVQLYKSLEDVKKRMLESRPAAGLMTDKKSEKYPHTAEDRGHEGHSRRRIPTLSHIPAVCKLTRLQILEHESGSGEGFAELIFGGSQEKEQTEQMFPKTLPSVDSKQGKTSQTNQAPLCSPKQQSSVRKDRPSCSPPLRRVTSARHPCLETLVWDIATCCRKTPDPLSIEDVCQQEHIEIIDCGFKLEEL
ncbi:uncharacterized protein si:ch211-130h14.4 isoform X2 [Gymnodraco acuticeps]|uniref:Uncharacterized protein si:ch211-130h14.4 isoform X2 n=1 Tax=Gymnodraco acuticeps TaxID=8218 RepID=A0A6P8U3E9_GYMAC|nr:uncharacterized protein si:ch211-130h14.4 isoform X2 [Gymnodraco acuticeps]